MSSDAFRVGLVLLVAASALLLAFQLPSDVFLDLGPNDGRYAHAFREDFEVDEPTIIHWSRNRSSVTLPFHLRGPYEVTLRYKRHVAASAEVRFFLGDEHVDTVTVPQTDFALLDLRASNERGGRFELGLVSSSDDPRPLGLALDWMQLRPARDFGAILPSAGALVWMLSWVLSFYVVPRVVGLGWRVATISSASAAAVLVALTAVHKLWPVHASAALGLRTHAIVALLVSFFLLRQRARGSAFAMPLARWAVFIVYVGLAVRLFVLFHPDFYYPDVRTHSKFVSLIWTEGLAGLFASYIENQHTHLLGLQLVGGRWLAFPYPPLLYLTIYPLSLLQLPVEEWMMIVPTALVAVEALMLFALANRLGLTGGAALVAVLLHASARVLAFRLAVASYAALFGHFWDTVAVVYLVFFFERIEKPRYALGLAALVAIAILSYAGSALVLGMFVPAFCLACVFVAAERRPEAKRLAAVALWSLAGALVAVLSFYWQYVPELLTRPGTVASSADLVEVAFTPLAALSMTAHRLNLFYGVFGFAAIAGLVFTRRKLGHPLAAPLAGAAMATFVGLNFLRAGLGATHIFQFSKDDLVILPVVACVLGILLDRWWRAYGKLGKSVTVAILLGWIGWSALWFSRDIRSRFIRPDYPPPAASSAASEHSRQDQEA
jgi:hypothetical protein